MGEGARRSEAAVGSSQLTGSDTLVEPPAVDEGAVLQFERGAAIDRYTVLGRIGAGAMGVVYTAYDPRLDRRVALKVMHARPGPRGAEIVARLLREAQALAKLSHPNVVAVYDADALGDLVYLTMELVDGVSLARWLKEARRSPAEVLRVFLDAGRGLAAAHAAGIVHRDFKPDNVLVGRDGRVRVVDFGIARGADGPEFEAVPEDMAVETPPHGPPALLRTGGERLPHDSTSDGVSPALAATTSPLADTDPARALDPAAAILSQRIETGLAGLSSMRLTRTGALVGTPAYMAPEQHLGVRLDARADQFAFCVALYEGLFGAHPFPAKNYAQLSTSVLGGKVEPMAARTDIAVHVRRAILRGLSVDPALRFAAMDDLLAALAPAERRRRALGGALVGAALAAALLGWSARGAASSPCEGVERHLAQVWDPAVKSEVRAAFLATGQPYAGRAAETSAEALDRHAARWTAMRRAACEATHVHGEQSPALLDRRMACLDRHLRQLAATAELFRAADSDVVQRAAAAVDGLPDLSECEDIDRLTRDRPRPRETDEGRAEVERALAQAHAQHLTAHYPAALALAERAAERADALDDPSLRAQALVRRGQVLAELGRAAEAAQDYAQAVALAERDAADELRAEATEELGATLGALLRRPDEGERLLRHAEAIRARVGASPLVQARIEVLLGTVLAGRGAFAEGRETLSRALDRLRRGAGDPRLSLITALNSLGSLEARSGDTAAALQRYREALALAEDRLGADHPDVAKVLNNIGVIEYEAGRAAESVAVHERALDIRRRTLGGDHPEIASSLLNLGAALLAAGEYAQAGARLVAAEAVLRRASGHDDDLVKVLYNLALSHHLRGEYTEALPRYAEALARTEALFGADAAEAAYPLHGAGVALVELGRLEEARPQLERALQIRTRPGVEPLDMGELRFALARALAGRDRARALTLAAAARDDFVALRDEGEIKRVDAWLREQVGR